MFPRNQSSDADSETQIKTDDVPVDEVNNDKDSVDAMDGHCNWSNVQNLPELVCVMIGDLKKVNKFVKSNRAPTNRQSRCFALARALLLGAVGRPLPMDRTDPLACRKT